MGSGARTRFGGVLQTYVSAPRREIKGTRFCSETTRVYPILPISQKRNIKYSYCIAVGCGVATTAALGTKKLKKHIRRENENIEEQKKCRKQRKAGKVQQVIDGGGVQVGTCERPGRYQPSPLRKNIEACLCQVYNTSYSSIIPRISGPIEVLLGYE